VAENIRSINDTPKYVITVSALNMTDKTDMQNLRSQASVQQMHIPIASRLTKTTTVAFAETAFCNLTRMATLNSQRMPMMIGAIVIHGDGTSSR
jgi:hypothetical protein